MKWYLLKEYLFKYFKYSAKTGWSATECAELFNIEVNIRNLKLKSDLSSHIL